MSMGMIMIARTSASKVAQGKWENIAEYKIVELYQNRVE